MKKNVLLAIISLFLMFTAIGVSAMGISDIGRVCLFSAISGTITLDGKPVVNAHLVRSGKRGIKKTDETFTNEQGYFEFPAMYERTITKYLPQEFVAAQKILVHYNDEVYEIWSGVKREPEENVESRGKPLIVKCELNSEKELIIVDGSPIHSRCIWDVDPDPEIDWEKEGFFDNSK